MYEDLFLSAFAFDQETVQICGKHVLTLFGFAVVPFTEVRWKAKLTQVELKYH